VCWISTASDELGGLIQTVLWRRGRLRPQEHPEPSELSATALSERWRRLYCAKHDGGSVELATSAKTLDDRRCDCSETQGAKKSLISQAVILSQVSLVRLHLANAGERLRCVKLVTADRWGLADRAKTVPRRRGRLCPQEHPEPSELGATALTLFFYFFFFASFKLTKISLMSSFCFLTNLFSGLNLCAFLAHFPACLRDFFCLLILNSYSFIYDK